MRPPLRLRAFISGLALILVVIPLLAQRYDSMSARELQRRLERDTDQLVNYVRNQRNSSGARAPSGPDPWVEQMRAREAQREADRVAREEQARLDREWRRNHPNETRQQYFARIEREAADAARETRQAKAAARRSEEERKAAEDAADWARVRASYDGYAAEVRPPGFETPAAALSWCLRHAATTQNEWAANQAAMLLIEGVGVPQNLIGAARLLDPHGPVAAKAGRRHPETQALHGFLQLTAPESVRAAGQPVDPAAARAALIEAASRSPAAKWYLARALNDSADPEDQKLALRTVTAGDRWARVWFAPMLNTLSPAREPLSAHVRERTLAVLEKQRGHLPTLMQELSLEEFEEFGDLLPGASPLLRIEAMTMYIETIARRIVPLTPSHPFNHVAFDSLLEQAEAAGIDGVDGLAALRRLHLLGIDEIGRFEPSWGHGRHEERALSALQRWGTREDRLGVRARRALQGLAFEAAASPTWKFPLLPEVARYQEAAREHARLEALAWIPKDSPKPLQQLRSEAGATAAAARTDAIAAVARRDSTAPTVETIPRLLAAMQTSEQWRVERAQLDALAAGQPIDPVTFAIEDPSFDLRQAAVHFEAAGVLGVPREVRRRELFHAMRLGDAFAPAVLAHELQGTGAVSLPRLHELSAARRARDVSARRSPALLVRAIEAGLPPEERDLLLAEAATAGSVVAARIRTAQRIARLMATEADRPPSWGLSVATMAELDASLADWATGNFSGEWDFLTEVLSPGHVGDVRMWLWPASLWAGDQAQRLEDERLIQAAKPQVEAVLETLAAWPGLNQQDPRHSDLLWEGAKLRSAAEDLAPTDGLEALKLFLQAAASGSRGALETFAEYVRLGVGGLPRSATLAAALQAVEIKMIQADAEVGDRVAAFHLAQHYLQGARPEDRAAGYQWLCYAAERGELAAAVALRDQEPALPVDNKATRRWTALAEAIESREYLSTPPRRLPADLASLTPLRAPLEKALAAAHQRLIAPRRVSDAERAALETEFADAESLVARDAKAGLLALAHASAAGSRAASFVLAQILAGGEYGLEPEPALAREYYALALKQLQHEAEYGDAYAAYRLGRYLLDLPLTTADSVNSVHWLSYAAERGETAAATSLAELYTGGAPGVAPDPDAAGRWRTFATATTRDDFKPRPPLRE